MRGKDGIMRRRSTFYIGLFLGLIAGSPRGLSYDALYAFGDSLTDTGREPAEPYFHYDGRWSNGRLWVEYLSVRLGFPYDADNNRGICSPRTLTCCKAAATFRTGRT